MPVLSARQLIEQADHLIVYRRPLYPRQADLRRAVSTSYYGVFHLICTDAADLFAGKGRRNNPDHALVYRSLDHGQLRKTCMAIQSPKSDYAISAVRPKDGFKQELVEFAAITVELQSARNQADYDPAKVYSVADARAAVQSAREAVALYEQVIRLTPAVDRSAFLMLLMFKRR